MPCLQRWVKRAVPSSVGWIVSPPKIYGSPNPVDSSLFGNRVFADGMKMRLCRGRVVPKSEDSCLCKRKLKET
jgi:hypothetical protein